MRVRSSERVSPLEARSGRSPKPEEGPTVRGANGGDAPAVRPLHDSSRFEEESSTSLVPHHQSMGQLSTALAGARQVEGLLAVRPGQTLRDGSVVVAIEDLASTTSIAVTRGVLN